MSDPAPARNRSPERERPGTGENLRLKYFYDSAVINIDVMFDSYYEMFIRQKAERWRIPLITLITLKETQMTLTLSNVKVGDRVGVKTVAPDHTGWALSTVSRVTKSQIILTGDCRYRKSDGYHVYGTSNNGTRQSLCSLSEIEEIRAQHALSYAKIPFCTVDPTVPDTASFQVTLLRDLYEEIVRIAGQRGLSIDSYIAVALRGMPKDAQTLEARDVMPIGKYLGACVGSVARADPNYMYWMHRNIARYVLACDVLATVEGLTSADERLRIDNNASR